LSAFLFSWELLFKNILKLAEISKLIDCRLIGDGFLEISSVASCKNPKAESIVYVSRQKYLTKKIVKKSGAILVGSDIDIVSYNGNFLVSNNHKLSFSKLTKLYKKSNDKNLTKSHYLISSSAKIGENLIFGNGVVIEENVEIGKNVSLGHNVVIMSNSKIGNNVTIDSGTIIGSEGFGNFRDAKNKWLHIDHIGAVHIKDNVSIGSNCTIDRGTIDNTVISSGVIIDNLVHIAHNVFIGSDTAIAAKVGIAGSCIIGKRNLIGGMVGIIDHITTTDDVTISATSTITSDLREPGVYTGIMPTSKHAIWKRVAMWIRKLDKIAKLLNLEKVK